MYFCSVRLGSGRLGRSYRGCRRQKYIPSVLEALMYWKICLRAS